MELHFARLLLLTPKVFDDGGFSGVQSAASSFGDLGLASRESQADMNRDARFYARNMAASFL